MDKRINRYKLSMVLFGIICIALSVLFFKFAKVDNYLYTVTVPFDWLGQGLRKLSLSGIAGNVVSWVIYILVGVSPLCIPIFRLAHKKKPVTADAVCVLTAAYTLFYLYILINPAFLTEIFYVAQNSDESGKFDKYILFTLFVSFVFTVIIMYAMKETSQNRVLGKIRAIVLLLAYAGIFSICFIEFSSLLTSYSTVQAGDDLNLLSGLTDYSSIPKSVLSDLPGYDPTLTTKAFVAHSLVILRYLAVAVPVLSLTGIVPSALKLLFAMEHNPYSDEIVAISKMISKRIKAAIFAILFSYLIFNLVQLLFAHYAVDIDIHMVIPLQYILIAFVMLFLTKYFSQSNRLHEENQQFV